jgi:hypothetical protein
VRPDFGENDYEQQQEPEMTTILLVWYALGWVIVGIAAIVEERLTLREFIAYMVAAPIVPVFLPFYLLVSILEQSGSIILWRRK